MVSFRITNEELFEGVEVDLSGVNNRISDYKGQLIAVEGDVSIEDAEGNLRDYSGEHGCFDYNDKFGFVIISE